MTVTLSPRDLVLYQGPLTATVTVSGSSGTPTGRVDVTGFGASDCPALALKRGRAVCQVYELPDPAGSHTVTATYSGDARYQPASGSTPILVARAPVSMELYTSPQSPAKAGSAVKFTVLLYNDSGYVQGLNSGYMTFSWAQTDPGGFSGSDGVVPGCIGVPVRHYTASCTTTLPPDLYELNFSYSGSQNFLPASMGAPYTFAPAALNVSTTTLPGGFVGSPYTHQLTATGGSRPLTWKIAAGGLPDGLTLGKYGVVSGTPTRTGKWSVTVAATDHDGTVATRALTLTISTVTSPIDTALGMTCPGAVFGKTTTCTLTATNKASGPAPTGNLQYMDGRAFLGGCTLPATPPTGASSSSCTVSIMWQGYGTETVDLSYAGDHFHSGTLGSATYKIASPSTTGLATTDVISCPGATDFASATCTITVTNLRATATPAPTGTAEFAFLNDVGEGEGQSCTLTSGHSTHTSHCTFSFDFNELPSVVTLNYYGDAKHNATHRFVTLHT